MALDSVNYRLLLANMKSFAVGAVVVPWIESYIAGRVSSLHVNVKLSVAIPMRSGAPQGSVICHLLFSYLSTTSQMPSDQGRCPIVCGSEHVFSTSHTPLS